MSVDFPVPGCPLSQRSLLEGEVVDEILADEVDQVRNDGCLSSQVQV